MVFRVRAALSEEDRKAWRRLAARQKRNEVVSYLVIRIAYVIVWGIWLLLRLIGLCCIFRGVTFLPRAVSGDTPLWLKFTGVPLAVVLIVCGIRVLFLFPHSPGWVSPLDRLNFLSPELPEGPDRAVFFEDGNFLLWDAAGRSRLGYSSIICTREDEERFYLFFQDRPPLLLPKRGFTRGTAEAFRDFLEREFGWPVERIK